MRTLDASTTTAVGEDITQPYYLVELDFSTTVYYSSTSQISWDSKTWAEAAIQVNLSAQNITVFNAGTTFGQTVLADGTSGRAITIYQGYLNDSAHPNPELVFSGEMADASIGDYVVIAFKRTAPLRSPRHYCTPPTLNHIPKAGTRFETPGGVVTLEGN